MFTANEKGTEPEGRNASKNVQTQQLRFGIMICGPGMLGIMVCDSRFTVCLVILVFRVQGLGFRV